MVSSRTSAINYKAVNRCCRGRCRFVHETDERVQISVGGIVVYAGQKICYRNTLCKKKIIIIKLALLDFSPLISINKTFSAKQRPQHSREYANKPRNYSIKFKTIFYQYVRSIMVITWLIYVQKRIYH